MNTQPNVATQVAMPPVMLPLQVVDMTTVASEVAVVTPTGGSEEASLRAQARSYAEQLTRVSKEEFERARAHRTAVETTGANLQRETEGFSEMLKQPIAKLAKDDEGGVVAKSLVDLRTQVEALDPSDINFGEEGMVGRIISAIPGVGSRVRRYFAQYESGQAMIAAILRSLDNGRDELDRDNKILTQDQDHMRRATINLDRLARMCDFLDEELVARAEKESDPWKKKFIQEELLFPLRQRNTDLRTLQQVNTQGVLAVEVILRNNAELIRGVARTKSTTVTALEIAVIVALALAKQKLVLDQITAVQGTTSGLLERNAERLGTQGVAIQKQAASAQLDLESLGRAWGNVRAAMDDLSTFKQEALPKMAQAIKTLRDMNVEGERVMTQTEEGRAAALPITIALQ